MRSGFITLAIVAVVLGVVMWTAPPPQAPPPAPAFTDAEPRTLAIPALEAAVQAAAPGASDLTLREHEARTAFHERVRTFFAQAPILSDDEKQRTARQLDEEIAEYENRRELSAAEALTLRLALIRETTQEDEQLERMQSLRDSYRAREQQRAEPAPDPMFDLYKAREQEIVAQVESLREIPGGLTREEYLRERLQREREALFGESGR
jgi:hypothetical protein